MAESNTPKLLFSHPPSLFRRELQKSDPRPAYEPSPFLEEQRDEYLRQEWTEEHGWHAKVTEKFNQLFTDCHTVCQVTEAELIKKRATYKPSTPEEVRTFEKEFPVFEEDFVVDRNGVVLMALGKDLMMIPWSEGKAKDLLELPWTAAATLAKYYPPLLPYADDQRHVNPVEERENCHAKGWLHGYFHLGARRPKGRQQQEVTMTAESHPNTEKGAAVNRWYQAMAPYHQTLGMILCAFDKEQYEYNRDIVQHWVETSLSAGMVRTSRACFTFHPVLYNARVGPHLDRNDSLSGMVVMTCTGDFSKGGNVIIRLFGRQYAVRNGGVMLLRASIIEHLIGAYEGQRYSFIHAMAENLSNLQDAKPAKLRGPGNKRPAADSDDETTDDGDDREEQEDGKERCDYCRHRFNGLKRHLAGWRKEPSRAEDAKHKTVEIRRYCDARWGPYAPPKPRAKKAMTTAHTAIAEPSNSSTLATTPIMTETPTTTETSTMTEPPTMTETPTTTETPTAPEP